MKLATQLLIISCPIAALAQGTVNFANDSTVLSSPPDRLIRIDVGSNPCNAYGTNNAPVTGTNFLVQLYYGANTAPESGLVPVSTTPAHMRASTSANAGTWAGGGERTLTGFPFGSGQVQLQVRIWDINFGATYEQALNSPFTSCVIGKSQPFLYTIPNSSGDPQSAFVMANFQGFTIFSVPEPSIFALVGLGAAVVSLARRKLAGKRG